MFSHCFRFFFSPPKPQEDDDLTQISLLERHDPETLKDLAKLSQAVSEDVAQYLLTRQGPEKLSVAKIAIVKKTITELTLELRIKAKGIEKMRSEKTHSAEDLLMAEQEQMVIEKTLEQCMQFYKSEWESSEEAPVFKPSM